MNLDRARSGAISFRQYIVTGNNLTGQGLVVDSDSPAQGRHWIIENATGWLVNAAGYTPGTPLDGLYQCPQGTKFPSSPTVAAATGTDLAASRPLILPFFSNVSAQTLSFFLADTAGLNLPSGWFIRLALIGIGLNANSVGVLTLAFVEEDDCK